MSIACTLPMPTINAELGAFGATGGSLFDVAKAYGEAHGFTVVALEPGPDAFAKLPNATKIMAILRPGEYEEITFRVPGRYTHLWIYGTPGEQRPHIIGRGPGRFLAAVSGQTVIIENVEISDFGGDTITQSAEADLLIRNSFIHSNGGRALFRGVGSYLSPILGGTYLIDSEFRDALSHTIYLDYGERSVISGCHIFNPGKNKHAIKNITRKSLVEFSRFDSGDLGTTPYDGMSGTDYAMVRGNTFRMHGGSSAMVSLQTRSAATGGFPAYPLPEVEWLGMAQAHLDAASYYVDSTLAPGWGFSKEVAKQNYKTGTPPSVMWTEQFWQEFNQREQYWLNNRFELTGDTNKAGQMTGLAVAHAHPVTWSQNNGVRLPVSDEWSKWLTEKVGGKATMRLIHAGNQFPAGLIEDIRWHRGIDQHYGDFPDKADAIVELQGEALKPVDIDPMLRRWTGAAFVAGGGEEPSKPVVIPPPVIEPDSPAVEPTPEPQDWETLAIKAEYSSGTTHYRELLQAKKRITY